MIVKDVSERSVTFPGSSEGANIFSVKDVPGRSVAFPKSVEEVDIFSD